MSEEEKNAFKNIEEEVYSIEDLEIQEIILYLRGIEDIKILLNLISKLQQENDLAKESLKQNCDIFDKYNQLLVEKQELNQKYEKALTDLANEDNKIIYLNKVIDKMAQRLEDKSRTMTKEKWKIYFYKEVEMENDI